VADLLKPLYDLMVKRVLESHVVCTDDTPMPMQAPGPARPRRRGCGFTWGSAIRTTSLTSPQPRRDGPDKFLGSFNQFCS